ncbi:MAG: hypothetical protein ACREFB_13100, partial [Stellaceae bacterium]
AQVTIKSPCRSPSRPIAIPKALVCSQLHTESANPDFVNGLLAARPRREKPGPLRPSGKRVEAETFSANDAAEPAEGASFFAFGIAVLFCGRIWDDP